MALDVMNRELKVGQTVVRVTAKNQSYCADLQVIKVSKISGNNIWLGSSANSMRHPQRLAIVVDVD